MLERRQLDSYGVMARNIVGSRVMEARRRTKPRLTQGDLAARLQTSGLGLSQSAVSKIEQGQRPVLDIEVVALAKGLRVSAAWLMGETEDPTPTLHATGPG